MVSTPKVIAKVVANTVAVTGSDEIAPPISTAPMKIASREAPIKIPVLISPNLMAGLAATGGLLPAVGFAILMRMLWSKQLSPYYFLGFVLAAYLKLPSVAVAAIGIIIVVL